MYLKAYIMHPVLPLHKNQAFVEVVSQRRWIGRYRLIISNVEKDATVNFMQKLIRVADDWIWNGKLFPILEATTRNALEAVCILHLRRMGRCGWNCWCGKTSSCSKRVRCGWNCWCGKTSSCCEWVRCGWNCWCSKTSSCCVRVRCRWNRWVETKLQCTTETVCSCSNTNSPTWLLKKCRQFITIHCHSVQHFTQKLIYSCISQTGVHNCFMIKDQSGQERYKKLHTF